MLRELMQIDAECPCYQPLLDVVLVVGIIGIIQGYLHTSETIHLHEYAQLGIDALVNIDEFQVRIQYWFSGNQPDPARMLPHCAFGIIHTWGSLRSLAEDTLAPKNRDSLFRNMRGNGVKHAYIMREFHKIIADLYETLYSRWMRVKHE